MSLPSPVLTRRPFRRESKRTLSVDVLLSRSRITNLAVVLLAGITALSLLVNLSYWLSSPSSSRTRPSGNSIFGTISRPRALQGLTHLVIVPGHAIWEGTDASARLDEDNWVLEPYQRDGGRVETFFQHIARGAEIVRKDESALLVFSGGQTRAASMLTEAESYLRLALAADVFKTPMYSTQPFLRVTTENHALDSYQNLLFSVARFHEYTGNYPRRITVVGYGMKEERFRKLHRMAIRWPENAFEYVGVDPAGESNALARQGERQNGYLPYSNDLYGCHSVLLDKRRSRNPFARFHSYYISSAALEDLLDYCPRDQTAVFTGTLPWS